MNGFIGQVVNNTPRTIWNKKLPFSSWFGRHLFSPKGSHSFSTCIGALPVCFRSVALVSAIVDGSVGKCRWTSSFIISHRYHYFNGWKLAKYFYIVAFASAMLVVIVLWWRRRFLVKKLIVRKRPSVIDIGPAIANFYDARSYLWETLWGEHMHHGYYGETGKEKKDRIRAQEDMIEELWKFAELDDVLSTGPVVRILDVGCGIGGAARYLAKKDPSIHVTGITLSRAQVERGNVLTKAQKLEEQVELVVADAHHIPFPDNSFDIVWSLESGEHMADKYLFLSELYRVLKPNDEERVILYSIYEAYRLPYICSLEELSNVTWKVGMTRLKEADWSASAFPFWIQVLQTAFSMEAVAELRKADWDTIRSVFAIRHMLQALHRKLLVLGALSGMKRLSV
ncbi:Probable tocopherol O-methyltransferase, chloroplastic [Galdieria sulphuraria]|nr:Probable tocopherol O-methyltransferase, chloroplastic [Galdieria sulphuraria]